MPGRDASGHSPRSLPNPRAYPLVGMDAGDTAMASKAVAGAASRKLAERFLNALERFGNKLPDPVAIFIIIIVILMAVSALGAAMGWSATNPASGEQLVARSLLSEDMIRQLLVEMPRTFTGFAPLGLILTIMLG